MPSVEQERLKMVHQAGLALPANASLQVALYHGFTATASVGQNFFSTGFDLALNCNDTVSSKGGRQYDDQTICSALRV